MTQRVSNRNNHAQVSASLFAVVGLLGSQPLPAQAQVVTVNATSAIRTVDSRTIGINTAEWSDLTHYTFALQEEGFKALRFPGGSASDTYHWTGLPRPGNEVTDWPTFVSVATAQGVAGHDIMITTDYGSGTPSEAASWVQDANVTRGLGIRNWEVGNEIYGSWEVDNHGTSGYDPGTPHDPVTYANEFKAYVAAMKAVDPTIKVGVPVNVPLSGFTAPNNESVINPRTGAKETGWTQVLLGTLKSLGVTPDFVSSHPYPFSGGRRGDENDASLLSGADDAGNAHHLQNNAAQLRQCLNDYLGANASQVEILVTELNDVGNTPGKQSVSLVDGLYLADAIGTTLQTEVNGVYWWMFCTTNSDVTTTGNLSSSLYGWRQYGDFSMIQRNTNDRYPMFYIAKMLQHFASAGDTVVSASSNDTLLSAYAVKKSNGSLDLLVINKSPSTTKTATFNLTGYTAGGTALVYTYGIPNDNAAQTGTGNRDLTISNSQIAGASFSYSFSPYSATVIDLGVPNGDTSSPTAPSGLTSPSQTLTSINLSWTPSTDNVGVVAYDVYNGQTTPVTTIGTSTTVAGLNPSTLYTFTVRARDAAGNMSPVSNSINVPTLSPVNLLSNGGFETGTLAPWVTYSGVSSLSLESSTVHSGHFALNVPGNSGGEQVVPGQPNTSYTLSAWGLINGSTWGAASLAFYDSSGTQISSTSLTAFGSTWSNPSLTLVSPPNTATVHVGLWFNNTRRDKMYVDDVILSAN